MCYAYTHIINNIKLHIAIYSLFHKYYPRRTVFAWSPPMSFFLHLDISRITASYKETYHAIYWHAYRVYATYLADMFMA